MKAGDERDLDLGLLRLRRNTRGLLAKLLLDVFHRLADLTIGPVVHDALQRLEVLAELRRPFRQPALQRLDPHAIALALVLAPVRHLDRHAVARLPDAPNVFHLAGQKFGTSAAPENTASRSNDVSHARISSSRSVIRRSATDWTRPAEIPDETLRHSVGDSR